MSKAEDILYKASLQEDFSDDYTKAFHEMDNAIARALSIKWKTLEQLDNYLVSFETHYMQRGGKISWATTNKEATETIQKVISFSKPQAIVNWSKAYAQELQINALELKYDGPYFHTNYLSKIDDKKVPNVFLEAAEDFDFDNQRKELFKHLTTENTLSIVSASYITSDGKIVFNEQNNTIDYILDQSEKIIVLVPSNHIIPTTGDIDLYNSLIASQTTGKLSNAYQKIISSFPSNKEVYVLIFDNERSDILAQSKIRTLLYDFSYGQDLNANTSVAINTNSPLNTDYGMNDKSAIYNTIIRQSRLRELKFLPLLYKNNKSPFLLSDQWTKAIDYCIHKENKDHQSNANKWGILFYKKMMMNRKYLEMTSPKIKNKAVLYMIKKYNKDSKYNFKIKKESFAKRWQAQFK